MSLLPKKRRYTPRMTMEQKLQVVFAAISSTNWTIGEFLYHAFKTKDEDGDTVHRGGNHAAAISQFLKGQTLYGPAKILDAWL